MCIKTEDWWIIQIGQKCLIVVGKGKKGNGNNLKNQSSYKILVADKSSKFIVLPPSPNFLSFLFCQKLSQLFK